LATEAFPAISTSHSAPRPVNRKVERMFFAAMAILLCASVVIGFSRTYFMAGMVNAPLPNALVHVHGAVFSLWMLLFLTQTALVTARRVTWHRTLGVFAFCLAPVMTVLGTITAIDGLRRGVSIGPLGSAPALSIALFGMVIFPILIWAAWRTRRRPDAHKRLVLLATLSLVEAGFGRFPWRSLGLTPAVGAQGMVALFLVILVAYDLFSLRRVHRTTMWAAPLTLAFSALAVPIGMTPLWGEFTAFLARHVAPYV
jgi:hypothetical protein